MKRSPWRFLWTAQDIRRKLLITLLLMAIYRLAAHVPVPGADREALVGRLSSPKQYHGEQKSQGHRRSKPLDQILDQPPRCDALEF